MERIFTNTINKEASDAIRNNINGDVASQDLRANYEARLIQMTNDADSYEESTLAPIREENSRYYDGKEPRLSTSDEEGDGEDDNRSSQVSTDLRDTIMAIVPSLMRVFSGVENIVDYDPMRRDRVEGAKSATLMANHLYNNVNNGFMLTHSVIKDLLTYRVGALSWYVDSVPEYTTKSYSNVTEEQALAIIGSLDEQHGEDSYEIVKADLGDAGLYKKLLIRAKMSKPIIKIEAIPPDELRVSPVSTTENVPLIGRKYYARASDLIKRGVDPKIVADNIGSQGYVAVDRIERNEAEQQYAQSDFVTFAWYYVEIDRDGDGIDELRYVEVVNDMYIVKDEPVDQRRVALFSGDPRPHTLIGDCVADLVKDIQDIKTHLLRTALDSASQSIFPRTVINELLTNVDDAMNTEMGAIIRTRTDPRAAVASLTAEFVGDRAFSMMSNLDMVRQSRTGISEASKGVDPKALQSTTVMGVDAIVSGAQERIELIAMLIAHTGFKQLFKGLLADIVNNPNMATELLVDDEWMSIDPSTFDPDYGVKVNPTLGRGSDMMRLQALNGIKEVQLMIVSKYGLKNPIVTPRNFLNTIEDMARLSNVRNVDRYFTPLTEEITKSIMSAPDEPTPEQLLAKAELEKVNAMTAKAISEKNFKLEKLAVDDDFRRDNMVINALVNSAKATVKGGTITDQPVIEQQNSRNEETQSVFSRVLNGG